MDDSAELFEAISHPVRIRILKILEKQPTSFASLKRQLNIESSGNLDHHLKKLAQLTKVRADGLYCLTDAGKEALLSIEAIEQWKETEKHKIRPLAKVPIEALALALLELATAALVTYVALSTFSPASPFLLFGLPGLFISAVVSLLGITSVIGVLTGKTWSWKTVIVKSALTVFQRLVPFFYLPLLWITYQNAGVPIPVNAFNLAVDSAILAAEAVALFLAFRKPVRGFLGIQHIKPSTRGLIGGTMSIISGALTILAAYIYTSPASPFGGGPLSYSGLLMFAPGFLVGVGGVLILLRNYVSGALMSIIFGLFPIAPAYFSALMLLEVFGSSISSIVVALVVGCLPIAGGILPLVNMKRKI
ncbi:MAG: winged helix-turn-helix domain-containing protein [Candidatus Bathyarchaeia archaeon]